MDRPQQTLSAIDELRQIRQETRLTRSLDKLRRNFDRVQTIRRQHIDDFDLQVIVSEVHEEIVERARYLRGDTPIPVLHEDPATLFRTPNDATAQMASSREQRRIEQPDQTAAEIPPEVPRLDTKSWQLIVGLAAFLALMVLVGFFYLIQTARKLNFQEADKAAVGPTVIKPAPQNVSVTTVSLSPTLRLYTDLVPGTVSVDEQPTQNLTDGELVLDKLQPGEHSIRVSGRSGFANFKFSVVGKDAPQIAGPPVATDALAVLVSQQDGHGRLITNAEGLSVLLDGKPVGEVSLDGLDLPDLGTADHELQVTRNRDRQRFILTYTPAPVLTVYVKSDPNSGTLVVMTGEDGVEVFIEGTPYRRRTEHGQLRIPIKVGEYKVRVHKDGFNDPVPIQVEIRKGEESAAQFRLEPAAQLASLQIKGAAPGSATYLDKEFVGAIEPDGTVKVFNIKLGDHTIELHHDQALPKKLVRTFHAGEMLVLSGSDVQLDKLNADAKPPSTPPAPVATPDNAKPVNGPTDNMAVEGERVMHGGGFISYHTPNVPGHYSFNAQGRVGGFLKHGKLQWYAGFQDSQNYILFSLDGKHADVR